jgi:DNA-binding NarL/FixJ family response regulator
VIRVLVVDDQALVRGGLAVLLDSAADVAVVGEAADGAEAVEAAHRLRPDVVLMDIRMPVLDGIAATRRILERDPDVRVLVLTTFDVDAHVYDALRAGASGFLLKDALPEELLRAVRVVAAGEALLAPRATRLLVQQFAARPAPDAAPPAALATLTDREREVLRLIATGLSNAEITERLVVSPATTKTHVSHLLAKLGARDRAQLVVAAYTSGLMGRTGG